MGLGKVLLPLIVAIGGDVLLSETAVTRGELVACDHGEWWILSQFCLSPTNWQGCVRSPGRPVLGGRSVLLFNSSAINGLSIGVKFLDFSQIF